MKNTFKKYFYGDRSLDYHHLRRYKLRSLTFSEIQVQIINIYGDTSSDD